MRKANFFLIVGIIVVIIGVVVFYQKGKKTLEVKRKQTAQEKIVECLNEDSAILYGSVSDKYTQNQRDVFGASFNEIEYVECGKAGNWKEECRKRGISVTPTWSFPEDSKTKDNIPSCKECIQNSSTFRCEEYCFKENATNNRIQISGTISLKALSKILKCSVKKDTW